MAKHKATRGEWARKAELLGRNADTLILLAESHANMTRRQAQRGGERFYEFAPLDAEEITVHMRFDESVLIAQMETSILRHMAEIKTLAEWLLDAETTNDSLKG